MTLPMFDLIAAVHARRVIDDAELLAIRQNVWPDGRIDPAEADAIFELNATVRNPSRGWIDFFVEAVTTYVVRHQEPVGYVDVAKAAWLTARIDQDGRVDSLGELEALVKILEDATNVPATLKDYALAQIERVVVTGEGPTRDGGTLDAGSISASECTLLRRMLFAQAGDGPACISRGEAEMLFRVKDATLAGANAPEWKTLFVQAIGNHLMAHSDYQPLSRERAGQLDAFMNDTGFHPLGLIARMLRADVEDGARAVLRPTPRVDRDAAIAQDQAITQGESDWLRAEVNSDRQLDPLEQAVLDFVAAESGTRVTL